MLLVQAFRPAGTIVLGRIPEEVMVLWRSTRHPVLGQVVEAWQMLLSQIGDLFRHLCGKSAHDTHRRMHMTKPHPYLHDDVIILNKQHT